MVRLKANATTNGASPDLELKNSPRTSPRKSPLRKHREV
jgi:hypothetical protein